jgi:hypothetical protein
VLIRAVQNPLICGTLIRVIRKPFFIKTNVYWYLFPPVLIRYRSFENR